MSLYLLSYDLIGTDEKCADYTRMTDAVKRLDPQARKLNYSVWAFSSDAAAATTAARP